MGYDIGPKIGIEGEAEFKKALNDINQSFKVLGSEMKKVTSEFDKNDNSVAALTAKNRVLNKQIDEQKKAVKLLAEQLNKAKKEYGETDERTQKLTIDFNNAEAKLNKLNREFSTNEKQLKDVKRGYDDAGNKLDEFGNKVAKVAVETDNATKKGGLLSKVFAGGFLANIASRAVSALTSKLKEFAAEGLQLASDLDEVQNVVDTTFGVKGAANVQTWADTAVKAFGLSELNAKRFNGTLGAMLKSSGITGNKLVEMSTTLSGVAADFASFYNLGIEESFDKIRQAVGGEVEGLKQLGINLNQANLMQSSYALSLGKTWQEMTMSEQAMTRYYAILELGADALGDFSKTSDSYANQLKIMQLETENLKTAMGQKLLPVVTDAVGWMSDLAAASLSAKSSISELGNSFSESSKIQGLIDKYYDVSTSAAELEQTKQDLIAASNGVVTAADLENGTFDRQVKVLKGANDAQHNYVKNQLIAAIAANSGNEAVKKSTKATEEQERARKKLSSANAYLAENEERLANGNFAQQVLLRNAKYLAARYSRSLGEAATETANVGATAAEATQAILTLSEGGMSAADIAKECGISLETVNSALSQTQSSTENTIPAVEAFGATLEGIRADYDAAYESASASLQGQYDLWTKAPKVVAVSVAEQQKALDSNKAYFETYNANMETLLALEVPGVDMRPLIESIDDGTPEAAARLQGLVNAVASGNTQIVGELAKSAQETAAEQDKLAQKMGLAQADVEARTKEAVESVSKSIKDLDNSKEAAEAAKNTLLGFTQQLGRDAPVLVTRMESLGNSLVAALNRGCGNRSPSKKTKESAKNVIDGAIIGLEDNKTRLFSTVESVGEKMSAGMSASLKSNGSRLATETEKIESNLVPLYANMGGNLLKSLATGMKNSSGQVMKTADDVAKELAQRVGDISSAFSTSSDIAELRYNLWELANGSKSSPKDTQDKKSSMLTEQIGIQEKNIAAVNEAYTKMAELTGVGSEESLKLQKQLLQEQIELEKLKDTLDELNAVKQATFDADRLAAMAEQEYKLWFYANENASDAEKIAKQAEVLAFKQELQEQSVADAEVAYEDMAEQYGINSEESLKMQGKYNDERIKLAELAKEIEKLNTVRGQYATASGMWDGLSSLKNIAYDSIAQPASSTDVGGAIASAVNAITSVGVAPEVRVVSEPHIVINGREVAYATLSDYRTVSKASPPVRSDRI